MLWNDPSASLYRDDASNIPPTSRGRYRAMMTREQRIDYEILSRVPSNHINRSPSMSPPGETSF
jgi:hypothetical protein